MPYYRSVGQVPRKRHTQFRRPDGGLYAEELMGIEGFSHDSALLYHRYLPTAIVAAEAVDEPDGVRQTRANHPLLPRHLLTHKLDASGGDAVTGRQLLMGNADVRILYAVADRPSPLYRNAIGDELVYIESGSGVLETVFGAMAVGPGDYVVLPTSTTHRWVPDVASGGSAAGGSDAGDPFGCSSARRPATSARPVATCPLAGSCSNTARTANATCADRPSRWSSRGRRPRPRTSRCWSGTARV